MGAAENEWQLDKFDEDSLSECFIVCNECIEIKNCTDWSWFSLLL